MASFSPDPERAKRQERQARHTDKMRSLGYGSITVFIPRWVKREFKAQADREGVGVQELYERVLTQHAEAPDETA